MSTDQVTLRRYKLPSEKGEGWALIVIGSDGYFSAVSDWGNYAYIWGAPGCEFRRFLVGLDASYFHSKICHMRESRVFDQEATEKEIAKQLWDLMGDGKIDKVQHDEILESLEGVLDNGAGALWPWVGGLDVELDVHCLVHVKPEPASWGFATKILPRFQALLREELAGEAAAPPVTGSNGEGL